MAATPARHINALLRASGRFDAAKLERNTAIHQARAHGVPVPEIAAAMGLTRGRVYQILNRKG